MSLIVICMLSFKEFHAVLNSLKFESGSRDQELRVLKENVSKLKEGIAELSSSINCFTNEDISASWNKDSDISKKTVDNTVDRKSNERTLKLPAESSRNISAATNGDTRSKQVSSKQQSETCQEELVSTVQEVIQSQGSPERPPLSRNKYGLKYRSVSINNDNRVKMLEGIERKTDQSFQNKSSSQTSDKLNLPTREALKKLQSTQKAGGTSARPKQ